MPAMSCNPRLLPAGFPFKPWTVQLAQCTRSLGQVMRAMANHPLIEPFPGRNPGTETHPALPALEISNFTPGPIVELIATFLM